MEKIRLYGRLVRKSKYGWKKYKYADWEFEPFVCGSCKLVEKGVVRLTDEERAKLQEKTAYVSSDGFLSDWLGNVVYDEGEDAKMKRFLQVMTFKVWIQLEQPTDWWTLI